ncbi:uncharacterized protein LOC115164325 [Salmo trutta]|uniref:uncharacterized protein LOC115164325 n=1 Tax=Salmo trutta TaxID=8032 RepID=UPI0011317377|nr:uncharacterized protein LOC115164325 [Salmo trutta]XP_029572555.1 uncharacterized protein LOC115164325 [Salmo trutta]XP_029572556.1 uncharacterized protein LOC115164325 [Salmo trutta]
MRTQIKHVACLQDPEGAQLYIQTGISIKGGLPLPTYRCARSSTSLECFPLHRNRSLPGTLASDTFYQTYLVDGLARWNQDHAVAATSDRKEPHSYSVILRHAANTLGEEMLVKIMVTYTVPRKYTGLGYLFNQTGLVLQDYEAAIEELETGDPDVQGEDDEGFVELVEFQDLTVPVLETALPLVGTFRPIPTPSTNIWSTAASVSPLSSTPVRATPPLGPLSSTPVLASPSISLVTVCHLGCVCKFTLECQSLLRVRSWAFVNSERCQIVRL